MPTLRLAATCAAALASLAAHGQPALPFDEASARAFVGKQVAAQGTATRFDVQVGRPDVRSVPAPCARTEFFVPAGARLWGRSALGLRCTDGATWTVMVPVTVTAWGPALVAAAPMTAGTVVTAGDVREEEIELTREGNGLVRETQQLQGRTLVRPVNAGQPLKVDMLRATHVLQAGDPVRLKITGAGFAISASGVALAAAGEGQGLRVRTDFGRVLTGIAREGRIVEVTP